MHYFLNILKNYLEMSMKSIDWFYLQSEYENRLDNASDYLEAKIKEIDALGKTADDLAQFHRNTKNGLLN